MSLSNNLQSSSDMSGGGLTEEVVAGMIATALLAKQDSISSVTDLNVNSIAFHGNVEGEPTSSEVNLTSLLAINTNFTDVNNQLIAVRARLDILETPP